MAHALAPAKVLALSAHLQREIRQEAALAAWVGIVSSQFVGLAA